MGGHGTEWVKKGKEKEDGEEEEEERAASRTGVGEADQADVEGETTTRVVGRNYVIGFSQ